jgi:alkanesulfonate monooxygenase SsuD/methylene tetrahydromethanopterin reductase-like flavin-dependent oxidoreductase (luciferase family)
MAEIETLMERFNAACDSHDGPRPKIMLLHHTYVARDDADRDVAARDLSRYYGYFGAWFQNKRPVRQGLIAPLSEEEIAANTMMAPENMARDLTIGTAQTVIDRIKRYEDLGYDEYAFWIDSGMSFERKRDSLARFLDDVMPAFA